MVWQGDFIEGLKALLVGSDKAGELAALEAKMENEKAGAGADQGKEEEQSEEAKE